MPGDADSYLITLITGSHIGEKPPAPFLLGTTVGVGIFSIFITDVYVAGTVYACFLNVATLTLCCFWLYYHRGFFASLAFFTIFLSLDQFISSVTYLSSAQSEMFYLVLCFVVYFHSGMLDPLKRFRPNFPKFLCRRFFITGFLGAFAVFSKPYAAGLGLYILLHLFFGKQTEKWQKSGEVLMGGIVGSLTFLFLYGQMVSFETIQYSFKWFFNADAPGWTDASGQVWSHGVGGYSYHFLQATPFSLISALLFTPLAYFDSKARNCFMCAWAYLGSMYLMMYLVKITANSPHDHISIFVFVALGLCTFLGGLFQKAQSVDLRFARLDSIPFINTTLNKAQSVDLRFARLDFIPFIKPTLNIFFLFLLFWGISRMVAFLHGFIAPPGGPSYLFPYQSINDAYILVMMPTLLITVLAFTFAKHRFLKLKTHKKQLPQFIESKPSPLWELMAGILLAIISATSFMESAGLITMIPIESRLQFYDKILSFVPHFATTFLLLLVIQCLRSRIFAVLLICVIGFIFVPQSTSSAFREIAKYQKSTDFFYDTFPQVIKQVKSKDFCFYVKSWLEDGSPTDMSYAIKIYRAYFDKLYPKAEPFKPLRVNFELLPGSYISTIGAERNIISSWSRGHLLTDDLEAVKKKKVNFSIVQQIKYKNIDYYVLRK